MISGVCSVAGEGSVQTDHVGFARQVGEGVRFALRRVATQHSAALGLQDFGHGPPDVPHAHQAHSQTAEICAALCR